MEYLENLIDGISATSLEKCRHGVLPTIWEFKSASCIRKTWGLWGCLVKIQYSLLNIFYLFFGNVLIYTICFDRIYLLLPPVTSLGFSRGEGGLYSWSYSRLVNRISSGRSSNSSDNSQAHQSVRNSSLKTRLILMLYLVFPSQLLNPSCRSLVSEVLVLLWREHHFL